MTHFNSRDLQEQLVLAELSFECTAIPAFWITQSGSIFKANQAACEALGYERDELQSLFVFDIDSSATAQRWSVHWNRLRAQKKLLFISHHHTKSGETRQVDLTANFLKIGHQAFNFAFAKDLTAQRDAELALKETQERHSLVIKAANDGIWDWDIESQQIYFSERWYVMLGFEGDCPWHSIQDWRARVHPDHRPLSALSATSPHVIPQCLAS